MSKVEYSDELGWHGVYGRDTPSGYENATGKFYICCGCGALVAEKWMNTHSDFHHELR